MKLSTTALSTAILSLSLLAPAVGQSSAQSADNNQAAGSVEAQHLVPAVASITHTLDSNSIHSGDQFRATLTGSVHLNGGVELHRGDVLLGQVANDDTNTAGQSRLAVRFTQAVRKNGQAVPIKATIVSFYKPSDLLNNQYDATEDATNDWTNSILSVDQIGVVKNVDLHSRIASSNSGVFVSTKDKNFKIPAGSEIGLAIGPAAQINTADIGD